MALQHFYSRVPARVSMYKKSDGFDTFAHSEGLSREFIERELAVVYENKLSKTDMTNMRHAGLLPVYSQIRTRSGTFVQSCVSYMPLDYTGERSAYLAHSLVFAEEECYKVLGNNKGKILNEEMFIKDIAPFAITSPTAAPNDHYPSLEYAITDSISRHGIVEKYDKETVKSFLYAVLLSLCGKGKQVYFKLPSSGERLSQDALEFMNELLRILPYPLRSALSFVTYVSDPTKYAAFKLKCMSEYCPDVLPAKGVTFDFQTDLIVGLHHDEVVANQELLEFFYTLLQRDDIRLEFLTYLDRVFEAIPNTQNLHLKTLTDLVFLFLQCSGFYPETQVLPDDGKVYDFLCVYEKYRLALSEDYRIQAAACLSRYANKHQAIPKNVFTKISKLYATELQSVKKSVMDVVLELIHTDVMREKLFVFIRNNYAQEEEERKRIITEDLSRVFYGGFLQNQLLEFFSFNFAQEPLQTQNQVLEKLLLSIRTQAVQGAIIRFIETHYQQFIREQKDGFYNTFFEMLPECDALAATLVQLVNRVVEMEGADEKARLKDRLALALDADYQKEIHSLMPLLLSHEGFCKDVVLALIFGVWNDRVVYTEYVERLGQMPTLVKTKELVRALSVTQELAPNAIEKLSKELENIYASDQETHLYVWMEADTCFAELSNTWNAFAKSAREKITQPAICSHLTDVFNIELAADGMDKVLAYAKENAFLAACAEYSMLTGYLQMMEAAQRGDGVAAAKYIATLPSDEKVRADIAEYILTRDMDRNAQSVKTTLLLDLFAAYLKKDGLSLAKLFAHYQEVLLREYYVKNGAKAKLRKGAKDSACEALKLLLSVCMEVCDGNVELQAELCKEETELGVCVERFTEVYGGNGRKWVINHLLQAPQNAFAQYGIKTLKDKQTKKSWLTKLFKK